MAKLTGKVALVTGGNSGMGLATARLFSVEGAKVVVTGRRHEALDEASKTVDPAVMAVQAIPSAPDPSTRRSSASRE